MTKIFREMTTGDLPAALDVRFSTIENAITLERLEQDYGITPESLAASMATHVRGWLCEVDGEVVGFAMGDRANGEAQVVAVRPGHEAKGIGARLLALTCDWLFAEGHDEVWLISNPDTDVRAHGFYRKLGWRSTGEIRGEDEVMVLRKPA
jgi:ribosomal protein S18 acetylase RimI-like enzyme